MFEFRSRLINIYPYCESKPLIIVRYLLEFRDKIYRRKYECSLFVQAQVSATPVGSVEGCAKAIVNSVCRGDRYLTEPEWFGVTYIWKVFCPELLEWGYRLMYVTRPGSSAKEAPSKKILDYTGAKNVLYPETLHSPEVKTD